MSVNSMQVSAGDALRTLRAGWAAQSARHLTASWMLHGRPGVGKSQIVRQLAEGIGAELFDVRLTTIEPQDLRGLPYYDHATKRTRWYRPEDLPEDPDRPSVLFLDELTAASPYLQPTVYGLLQERRIGRHVLPDSVLIVAAGNSVEDGAVAYEMGTALSDRLIHMVVRADPVDWLENYAALRGVHPAVTAFIKTRPDLFETTETALAQGRMIAATPRSWERVSDILATITDRRMRDIMVAGCVGEEIAAEFALIADDILATVQVTEMLEASPSARTGMYPATMHGLHALIYGLVGVLEARTAPEAIAIMAQIRRLGDLRPEPVFGRMPLGELSSHGFEMLIRKGLDAGLADTFLRSEAYREYAQERADLGLE